MSRLADLDGVRLDPPQIAELADALAAAARGADDRGESRAAVFREVLDYHLGTREGAPPDDE